MASLVLILSELLRPERAELLAGAADYRPGNGCSSSSVSTAVFAKAAKSSGKPVRPASRFSNEEGGEAFEEEDLSEVKISIESIWP